MLLASTPNEHHTEPCAAVKIHKYDEAQVRERTKIGSFLSVHMQEDNPTNMISFLNHLISNESVC